MSYTLLDPQPALKDGELGLELDDGTLVAVAVKCAWQSNNAGAVFTATCRQIDADGATHICPNGNDIQTSLPLSADHGFVDAVTDTVIQRELMYAVLGEPQSTKKVDTDTVTLLMLSDDLLNGANIRKAVATAAMAPPTADDLSSLLGL